MQTAAAVADFRTCTAHIRLCGRDGRPEKPAAMTEDPEAFRALCEIPVEFRNKDRHSDYRRLAPIIALDAKVDRGAPFASKPAPTLDRVTKVECSQMWERACSRRGQHSHHKSQQKKAPIQP